MIKLKHSSISKLSIILFRNRRIMLQNKKNEAVKSNFVKISGKKCKRQEVVAELGVDTEANIETSYSPSFPHVNIPRDFRPPAVGLHHISQLKQLQALPLNHGRHHRHRRRPV